MWEKSTTGKLHSHFSGGGGGLVAENHSRFPGGKGGGNG